MPDQSLAVTPASSFAFEEQGRPRQMTIGSLVGTGLSLLVIAAALWQVRNVNFAGMLGMVPKSPLFWAIFAVSYLAGPMSEWIIFRRLWGVGPAAFGALVRKLIYNELLVGYLGEVYFYTWARQHLKFVATPFGAVKDVAVLSAVSGNVMTLLFMVVAFPFLKLLPLHDHATAIGWSLAFVIGTSLAIMFWRRSIFSLRRDELLMVLAMHVLRILAITGLSAALWHMVLPDTPLGWWLILATIRLLISRLPFVPNKDVVFAGVAVLALGEDVQLAALMAMMAALILITHVLVGLSFAIADLIRRKANATDDR
ncbi:MAG: hypothetical protein KDE32_08410 [Novosphingobium sp.]|nr:hypothetical protein [Novosphingobium sp.]